MRQRSELPIGVFDSGIGGLTVARQIRRVLPLEDLIYLGDTARVPYGTKSPEAVIRFACEDTRFLLQQGCQGGGGGLQHGVRMGVARPAGAV